MATKSRAAGVVDYRHLSYSNPAVITLPQQGAATPYPSSITVGGVTGRVAKVTVTLANLEHSYPSDLDVLLVGPRGQAAVMLSDVGGEWSATNLTVTFDDDAPSVMPRGVPLVSGTFRPSDYRGDEIFWDLFDPPAPSGPHTNTLSIFAETDPNGRWDLYVMDSVDYDAGLIRGGWSLTLAVEQPLDTNVNVNATYVQEAWAEARSSTLIAVQVAFTGDDNRNGYTSYEVGPSANGPWSRDGVGINDVPGPLEWRASVIRVTPGTANFVRVTFSDPEGVFDAAGHPLAPPQIIAMPGRIMTPSGSTNPVRVEPLQVEVRDTEIFVSVPIRDDANWNSSGAIFVATNAAGPWIRKCGSLPLHPKRGRLRSLVPGTDYWIRTTITDTDGVSGPADQVSGPFRYTGLENLAYGRPVSTDPGWGCCPNPQQLVDGRVQDDDWYYGFAWTGGTGRWLGEPGWKQARVDLGQVSTLNRALIWFHGPDNVPLNWRLQHSLDGATWLDTFVPATATCRTTNAMLTLSYAYPSCGHEARFTNVVARYVRYVFDDRTLFNGIHGWAEEIEVFGQPNVETPPIITQQPQNLEVLAGASAAFTVAVDSPVPVTYQWLFNGPRLLDRTNATLSVTNARPANAGTYSVIVSNRFGVVTSLPATLRVLEFAPSWELLQITNLPANCYLAALWARSRTEVYVWAGRTRPGTADTPEGFILRGDGTRWQVMTHFPGHYPQMLYGTGEAEVFATAYSCLNGDAGGCGPTPGVKIFRSVDRGTNWTEQALPLGVSGLNFGYFSGSTTNVHLASIDPEGRILRFNGSHWSSVYQDNRDDPLGLYLLSPEEGYFVTCWGWGRWSEPQWQFQGPQFSFCNVLGGLWGVRDAQSKLHLYAAGTHDLDEGVRIWKFNELTQSFGERDGFVFADGPTNAVGAPLTNGLGSAMSIWGSAADDVYVTGDMADQPYGARRFRLYHYDGQSWAQAADIGDVPYRTWYGGISGTARDDVWVSLYSLDARDGRILHLQSAHEPRRPEILRHPQSVFAISGQTVKFDVLAAEAPLLTYQWLFDGTNLPGATGSRLSVPNATLSLAGPYSVVVSGAGGSVTSQVAHLFLLTPPVIIQHPQSLQTSNGATVEFTVEVVGGPLGFKWRLNEVNIPGATNVSLILSNVQPSDGGSYSVVVTNPVGATFSLPATLVVTNVIQVPLLASENDDFHQAFWLTNADGFLPSGSAVGSNLCYSNELPLEPRHAGRTARRSAWLRWSPPTNGIATFDTRGSAFDTVLAVYAGDTLAGLIEAAGDDDGDTNRWSLLQFNARRGADYFIALDGFAGQSGPYSLNWSLRPTANELPVIVTKPQSQAVRTNLPVTFSLVATSATPLAYQWRFNGADLPGETAAALLIPDAQFEHLGQYDVRMTNACCAVTSPPAFLELTSEDHAGLSDPKPEEFFARFFTNHCPAPARLRSRLVPAAPAPPPGGFVSVAFGSVGWHTAPTILPGQLPAKLTNCQPVVFGPDTDWNRFLPFRFTNEGRLKMDTRGSRYPTRLYLFNPSLIPTCPTGQVRDGDTPQSELETFITPEDGYHFALAVTDGNGPVNVNWVFGEPPASHSTLFSTNLTNGASLSLSVDRTGWPAPAYQWHHNGQPMADATNRSLHLSSVGHTNAGLYSLFVSNGLRGVNLDVAHVTVEWPPEIIELPARLTQARGADVVLAVRALGAAPLHYAWWHFNTPLQSGAQSTLTLSNVQAGHAGTYRVVVSNSHGSVSTNFTLRVLSLGLELEPSMIRTSFCSTVAFTARPAEGADFSYTWLVNGNPMAGAAGETMLLPSGSLCSTNRHRVTLLASNALSMIVSNTAELSFAPPELTTPPHAALIHGMFWLRLDPACWDRAHRVEWSTNLMAWEPAPDGLLVNGAFEFTVPLETNGPPRFYRMRVDCP